MAVTREGEVGAGDEIVRISREMSAVPVSEITRLYVAKRFASDDEDALRRIMSIESVPGDWKGYFRKRIEKTGLTES